MPRRFMPSDGHAGRIYGEILPLRRTENRSRGATVMPPLYWLLKPPTLAPPALRGTSRTRGVGGVRGPPLARRFAFSAAPMLVAESSSGREPQLTRRGLAASATRAPCVCARQQQQTGLQRMLVSARPTWPIVADRSAAPEPVAGYGRATVTASHHPLLRRVSGARDDGPRHPGSQRCWPPAGANRAGCSSSAPYSARASAVAGSGRVGSGQGISASLVRNSGRIARGRGRPREPMLPRPSSPSLSTE